MKQTFLGLALVLLMGGAYSGFAGADSSASLSDPELAEATSQAIAGELENLPSKPIGRIPSQVGEARMSSPCLMECRQDLADCREDGNPVSVCRALLAACRAACG